MLSPGTTRTANGLPDTGIVVVCCREATSITPTDCENWVVTYARVPVELNATSVGVLPTETEVGNAKVGRLSIATLAASSRETYATFVDDTATLYGRPARSTR